MAEIRNHIDGKHLGCETKKEEDIYWSGYADAIDEFVEKFDDYRSASDRYIYAMEMVREVAEQLKENINES